MNQRIPSKPRFIDSAMLSELFIFNVPRLTIFVPTPASRVLPCVRRVMLLIVVLVGEKTLRGKHCTAVR